MSDVTRILSQTDSGDPAADNPLQPVYEELPKLAATTLAAKEIAAIMNGNKVKNGSAGLRNASAGFCGS
jgi:hypothetical protein